MKTNGKLLKTLLVILSMVTCIALFVAVSSFKGGETVYGEAAYKTVTTKTLLKEEHSSKWYLSGATKSADSITLSSGNTAFFRSDLSDTVYSMDFTMTAGGDWFAVYLNTDVKDAMWNGVNSFVLLIYDAKIEIMYYNYDGAGTLLGSVPVGCDFTQKTNLKCGLYENEGDYRIYIAVNGAEIYNSSVMASGRIYRGGFLGLFPSNKTVVVYATDSEVNTELTGETLYRKSFVDNMLPIYKEEGGWFLTGASYSQDGSTVTAGSSEESVRYMSEGTMTDYLLRTETSFDIHGDNWVAVYFNAESYGAPWDNSGYLLLLKSSVFTFEKWSGGQAVLISETYPAGTDISEKNTYDFGCYTESGKTYFYFAINGVVLINAPFGDYTAGKFGFYTEQTAADFTIYSLSGKTVSEDDYTVYTSKSLLDINAISYWETVGAETRYQDGVTVIRSAKQSAASNYAVFSKDLTDCVVDMDLSISESGTDWWVAFYLNAHGVGMPWDGLNTFVVFMDYGGITVQYWTTAGTMVSSEKFIYPSAFDWDKKTNVRMGLIEVEVGDKTEHYIIVEMAGVSICCLNADDENFDITAGKFGIVSYSGNTSKVGFTLYPTAKDGAPVPGVRKNFSIVTSKTLLNESNLGGWELDGVNYNASNKSLVSSGDQTRAFMTKSMPNTVVDFNVALNYSGNAWWVAISLNANMSAMPWTSGFTSFVVFLQPTGVTLEYWTATTGSIVPEGSYGFAYPDGITPAPGETFNVKAGIYAVNGEHFAFVAINNTILYKDSIQSDDYLFKSGMFGLSNYGNVSFVLYATDYENDGIPSSTVGDLVDRDFAHEDNLNKLISEGDWAIISDSGNPSYAFNDDEDSVTLSDNGDLAYANKVNFTKLAFSFKFGNNAVGQQFFFMFSKKRMESFIGQTLSYDPSNYGYGVKILPNGLVSIVKTDSGAGCNELMCIDCMEEYGIRFSDGLYHSVMLYRTISDNRVSFSLFIDNFDTGYSVVDNTYRASNYPAMGYIAISNSKDESSVTVKDVRFDGTYEYVADSIKADSVYLCNIFADGNGGKYLYFRYYGASCTTKWVDIYASNAQGEQGELLGRVFPQECTLDLTDCEAEYIIVRSVSFAADGSGDKTVHLSTKVKDAPVFDETKVERIRVKASEDGAYLVYSDSGKTYTPVGGNFMGLRDGDHSTFDADTTFTKAYYNHDYAESMLKTLSDNYCNFVRVFIIGRSTSNPGISGDSVRFNNEYDKYYYEGLYKPYMENVADFLRTAKKYGVYVMITLGDCDVPSNGYYYDLMGGSMLSRNQMYMTKSGIRVRTTYAANVVKYFQTYAPECIPAILSISCQNEFAMRTNEWPYDLTSGTVTLANGKTYDMSKDADRDASFKDSVIYYLNAMSAAIKAVDPDMLVSEGTYTRNIAGCINIVGMRGAQSGNPTVPATFDIYLSTDIDFLDLHVYYVKRDGATVESSLFVDLDCMKYEDPITQDALKRKCIVMGEFGPSRKFFTEDEDVLYVWTETVNMARDFGFRGFCCWTLDSFNQTECWHVMQDDGKMELLREMVLSFTQPVSPSNVYAENIAALTGEPIAPVFHNLIEETDFVYYYIEDGEVPSEDLPVFQSAGQFTVNYVIVRPFTDRVYGSFTVIVSATTHTIKFMNEDGSAVIDEISAVYGEKITPPEAPAKEGFAFVGYYDENGNKFDSNVGIEGDAIYYARYADKYTVTFKDAEGNIIGTYKVSPNETVDAPDAPEISGREFIGYYTTGGVQYETGMTFDADTEFTAVYSGAVCIVRFYAEDGTLIEEFSVNIGGTVVAPDAPVSPEGDFVGWFDADGNEFDATQAVFVDNDYTAVYDKKPGTVKVTFLDIDGKTVLKIKEVKINGVTTAPYPKEKTGYLFAGYYDENGVMFTNVLRIESDTTFIARYSLKKFTVTFYEADGETVIAQYEVDYGTKIETPKAPDIKGKEFVFYANGEIMFVESIPVCENMAYKAMYAEASSGGCSGSVGTTGNIVVSAVAVLTVAVLLLAVKGGKKHDERI